MKKINFGTILFTIIELSFVLFLPVPVWLKVVIVFALFALNSIWFANIIYALIVVAGWVWSYIYVWFNVQYTGWTIFYMIMLLLFGIEVLLMKTTYQKMDPLHRPPIVDSKGFSVIMTSVSICAYIADIAMLIHLIAT